MSKLVYFVDDDTVANQLFKRACNKIDMDCEVFDDARLCLGTTTCLNRFLVLLDDVDTTYYHTVCLGDNPLHRASLTSIIAADRRRTNERRSKCSTTSS